ncbi:pectinesterase/pectinesterase inhibitor 3, partial [Phtheirospermum japonicum]
ASAPISPPSTAATSSPTRTLSTSTPTANSSSSALIAGTVDFIFGNGAAVLQNCDIHARRPNSGQRNMVTAQGRTDPNQNTGIRDPELPDRGDFGPERRPGEISRRTSADRGRSILERW